MKAQHKVLATRILWGGSIAILLFIFIIGNRSFMETRRNTEAIKSNTEATQTLVKELQKAVKDIQTDSHNDHDLQIKYVQCIVNLFGSRPGQIITQADFDKCLAGTRIVPTDSVPSAPQKSTSTPSNTQNSQNKNTTTNSSVQQGNTSQSGLTDNLFKMPSWALDLILSNAKAIHL